MRDHKDYTADRAIEHASDEWKQMAQLAVRVRNGRGNPVWIETQTAKFTGIFRRLLEDPIELVIKEAR